MKDQWIKVTHIESIAEGTEIQIVPNPQVYVVIAVNTEASTIKIKPKVKRK